MNSTPKKLMEELDNYFVDNNCAIIQSENASISYDNIIESAPPMKKFVFNLKKSTNLMLITSPDGLLLAIASYGIIFKHKNVPNNKKW